MERKRLETEQKALEINLNDKIYGSFAEIGAGQEVARFFFQAGAASRTIAKTISAYDKQYSDVIYGKENNTRYVCKNRLVKMLDKEYNLMEQRLREDRSDNTFFAFADTVAAINFHKTINGDGWLGLRFQLEPDSSPNDVILHTRLLDQDTLLQQESIGVLGVNLIYACYYLSEDMDDLIVSLHDGLKGRLKVDFLSISGPDFPSVDNRLLALKLIQYGLTDVTMFLPDKQPIHGSEFLYKKNVVSVRASFKPTTNAHMDMFVTGIEQFNRENSLAHEDTYALAELTMEDLTQGGHLDEKDFLERADLLCAMDKVVVLSNCETYERLISYLSDFKVPKIALVIRADDLKDAIYKTYDKHKEDGLVKAFGEVFTQKVTVLVYPLKRANDSIMSASTIEVPETIKFLYQHFLDNKQIKDLEFYHPDFAKVRTKDVTDGIKQGGTGWEKMVPRPVAKLIKEKCMLGYPCETMDFEL